MENYYQPEMECASREQIRAWQDERLVKYGPSRVQKCTVLPEFDGEKGGYS